MHYTMIFIFMFLWKTICRDLSDNHFNSSTIPSWVTSLPDTTTVYVVPYLLQSDIIPVSNYSCLLSSLSKLLEEHIIRAYLHFILWYKHLSIYLAKLINIAYNLHITSFKLISISFSWKFMEINSCISTHRISSHVIHVY